MIHPHSNSKASSVMRLLLFTLTLLLATTAGAQEMPVKFSVQQKQVSPTEVDVVFTAKIDKGWHVYSTNIPDGGPTAATMHTEKAEGAQPMGGLIKQGKEISEDDQIFGMRLSYFENAVTFIQKYKITAKTYNIKGYLEFGACNDEMCMPPYASIDSGI